MKGLLGLVSRIIGKRTGVSAIASKREPLLKATDWKRWSPEHLQSTQRYLEAKSSTAFDEDDWLQAAQWIISRYLPDGVIENHAQYQAVLAKILVKIRTSAANPTSPLCTEATANPFGPADRISAPTDPGALQVAESIVSDYLKHIPATTRPSMTAVILDNIEAQCLGKKEGTSRHLAASLFDQFAPLNLDFECIAVTITSEVQLQSFIAGQPYGSHVIRREAYNGACRLCQAADGREFTVVDPAEVRKDGESMVWVGKTNLRPFLIANQMEWQRWSVPAGVMHPMCRGVWLRSAVRFDGACPDFLTQMENLIAEHRRRGLRNT